MSIATTAEQRAIAEAITGWAARHQPAATARGAAHTPDGWRKHWAQLAEAGIFNLAQPAELGGADGQAVDVAVMVESAARALVPGPVLPSALVGLLLADRDVGPAARQLVASAQAACAMALDAGGLQASRQADGALVVSGSVAAVLGADEHTALLLAAADGPGPTWFLLDPHTAGVQVRDLAAGDFTRALAEVRLVEVRVPPEQLLTGLSTERVRELAAVLVAAEASGIASWCVDTAVQYAKVRVQFGKPIGSFQAVKHLCAQMLCRAELASAVAWDGAVAAADPAQLPLAAAVAASIAPQAAFECAKDCIQVLGGIGFTWEHDAHLYLRRATALRQLLGRPATWRQRTAELTVAGARRHLHVELGDGAEAQRAAIGEQARRIAALPAQARRTALAAAGLLAPHWPRPYGLDADPALQLLIDEELTAAGVSRPDLVIGGWAAPTILAHGTPEQAEQFVGPTLRGELTWCQLFSEPEAGSDLAGLRTRARRVDGGWLLSGQKVWTSVARSAHWGICLARTDPDAPKHRGISYFLLEMASPGIEVRPLREITGQALFNEVFLDDVFVPDAMLVGQLNDGWRLARSTLANERVAMAGGSSLGEATEQLVQLAAGLADLDAAAWAQLGERVATAIACSVLEVRAVLDRLDGNDAAAASSVRKLVGVQHRQAVAETALELLGPAALLDSPQLSGFLQSRCLTIAGGTTQVLLSVVGERLLGLPRD